MQAKASNYRLPEKGDPTTSLEELTTQLKHLREHNCGFNANQAHNILLNAANLSDTFSIYVSTLNIKKYFSDSEESGSESESETVFTGFDTPGASSSLHRPRPRGSDKAAPDLTTPEGRTPYQYNLTQSITDSVLKGFKKEMKQTKAPATSDSMDIFDT